MDDVGPFKLQNDLATLRLMSTEDAPQILQWRTSDRSRFLHEGAKTVDDQIRWMSSRPGNEFNFIIECSCGCPIGMISLVNINPDKAVAEPARFIVGKAFSSGGFAVSASSLLYDLAFERLQIEALVGHVAEQNVAMVRWHESFGMEVTGFSESAENIRGLGTKMVSIRLTRDRYRTITVPRMNAYLQLIRKKTNDSRCPCSMATSKR
jgi:RimJ/RimL family protein N-acetyltransferase